MCWFWLIAAFILGGNTGAIILAFFMATKLPDRPLDPWPPSFL